MPKPTNTQQQVPTDAPPPSDQPLITKPESEFVDLYSSDFAYIHKVPRTAIHQLPAAKMHITRLVVCKNYSASVMRISSPPNTAVDGNKLPEGQNGRAVSKSNNDVANNKPTCPMGIWCRFAHVSRPLSEFPRQAIHAHYIWRSVEDVTYERLIKGPIGPTVRLAASYDYRSQILKYREQQPPQDDDAPRVKVMGGDVDLEARTEPGTTMMVGVIAAVLPSIRVPATRLLLTAGAVECMKKHEQGGSTPDMTLCLQYLCENECRLGSACPDAHVINLDASLEVPFVRRTAKQIKNAAIAMDFVNPQTFFRTDSRSTVRTMHSAVESEDTTADLPNDSFDSLIACDEQSIVNTAAAETSSSCCGEVVDNHNHVYPISLYQEAGGPNSCACSAW